MAIVAIPGQVLGSTTTHTVGPGTHAHDSKIYASILGSVLITTPPASAQTNDKPTISIPRAFPLLPTVGTPVLARITRVQQRQATALILVVDPRPATVVVPYTAAGEASNEEVQFQAVLRREDVRGFEKDKVVMNEVVRVGDVVRAVVINLGDERNYYVSTQGDENGVLVARGVGGGSMVPRSWREMEEVGTGRREGRKVARPF